MRTPSLFLVLALTALAGVGPLAAQGKVNDIVVAKSGRKIRGVEVVEMTTSTVKYMRGDQENELPAHLLASVTWDEPPEAFALAGAEARKGNLTAAADLYAEAAQKTDRAVLKLEARYLAAEALVRGAGGDPAKAQAGIEALRGYLSDAPEGYRVPSAMLQLGRALQAAGKHEEAAKTLGQLANDSLAKNWGAVWDARAKFEQARSLLAQNDLASARATFRSASSAADLAMGDKPDPELLELKAEAAVGEGETFVAEKKYDDALAFFRELAARSGDAGTVRAAAKAGEGEALYLRAVEKGEAKGLRAAQIALAEANLLDQTAGATTAKSLYYSGKVLLALGDRAGSNFARRANEYFSSVVRYYPDTIWTKLATEELKR